MSDRADPTPPAPAATPAEPAKEAESATPAAPETPKPDPQALIRQVEEIGGPPGPEPTRYGDWQFNGKVTDF